MNPWLLTATDLPERVDVLIIGAGPAGLCAAAEVALRQPTSTMLVLEGDDAIGGRVRTVQRDGFLLDRGFQVLNTAYPEVQTQLDLDALQLGNFLAGAAVRHDGRFQIIADPRRHPLLGARTLQTTMGSLGDKLRTAQLALSTRSATPHASEAADESTAELLARAGTGAFGELMLRPFFRGVFLEPELRTSAAKFRWLLKMFGSGNSSLPADGLGAVTRQLAAKLPDRSVALDTRVELLERLDGGAWQVHLASRRPITATTVVVAAEQQAAFDLVNPVVDGAVTAPDSTVTPTSITHYYALPSQPRDRRPVLLLGTREDGPIDNAALVSNVQPHYAPAGRALLQATVVPDAATTSDGAALEPRVRTQLRTWFGGSVDRWEHIHTDHLTNCLPFAAPGSWGRVRDPKVAEGLYVAGDHVDGATLDGALRSGRIAGADAAFSLRVAQRA
ncbi:MAG: FAD-dependent oxidoreductase [Thermoleophilia bacterium]|nr:FAD-dependent oxidoreductase [Thermoleophilia bacterium]